MCFKGIGTVPIRTVFNDQTPTSAVAAAGSGVAAPGVTERGLMEVVEVSLGGNGHAGTRGVHLEMVAFVLRLLCIHRQPINVHRPLNRPPPAALLPHYNLLLDSAHAMVTQQLAQGIFLVGLIAQAGCVRAGDVFLALTCANLARPLILRCSPSSTASLNSPIPLTYTHDPSGRPSFP